MPGNIVITPGLADGALSTAEQRQSARPQPRPRHLHRLDRRAERVRALAAIAVMLCAFVALGGQLVRLALKGAPAERIAMSTPMATAFARPDIVDRNGRLLAGDIVMPSVVADPSEVLDAREIADRLATVLPGLDRERVIDGLADRSKRFAWLSRGVSPAQAQAVHDLGLPGVGFRYELRRAYPLGQTAGQVIGFVDIDNKGLSGLEQHLDTRKRVEPVHGTSLSAEPALKLSLDVAVQFAMEDELAAAMARYDAKAAAGVIMDVHTGEILAAASLPGVDPLNVAHRFDETRIDRLTGGVFELGSVFKVLTVAMALDGHGAQLITPETQYDVRQMLDVEGYRIGDLHPAGRPLSVREIVIKSSNVGAGLMALEAGQDRQRQFLERLGLIGPMATEAGGIAPPTLPARWGEIETVTISYGHGIAVAPLQFAAASAALVNGGTKVVPTFLKQFASQDGERVVSVATSRAVTEMLEENVMGDNGTGRRARVAGLRVGGKTGTAEIPGAGGYREKAVIASFLGAFPMEKPRYLTLVSLFEPKPTAETGGEITAGRNAAPTTARIIERVRPLIDLDPQPAPKG